MSVLVTDAGFSTAPNVTAVSLAEFANHEGVLDLANTDDPAVLDGHLGNISLIRVAFPSYSDGRGFTIGRRLRMMGYTGTLRATGNLVADQYAMARRVGFDDVEISDELALRQPADQWLFRADWRDHDYLGKLRA
jgi:uncharacterized protein (DUF934 family)